MFSTNNFAVATKILSSGNKVLISGTSALSTRKSLKQPNNFYRGTYKGQLL